MISNGFAKNYTLMTTVIAEYTALVMILILDKGM